MLAQSHDRRIIVFLVGVVLLSGCFSRPGRIHPPEIDSKGAGEAAISAYDKDGDSAISGSELDEAPPLKSAMNNLDLDRDGKITADEIAARIDNWKASKAGLLMLPCQVILNGRPLDGATITLVPESFLGVNVKPASGVTDAKGRAVLTIAEEDRVEPDVRGVQCGYFRVQISKQRDGKETLPARYNVESTLGCEITPPSVLGGLRFALTGGR